MAVFALTDVFVHVDGHDYSCDSNVATLDMTAAELDVSTFCSNGWKEVIAGVKTTTFNLEGFWQAGSGEMDPEVHPNLGGTKVFTIGPTKTDGEVAYFWRGGEFHYEPFKGSHGDVAGFLLSSVGKDGYGVVRGARAMAKVTTSTTGVKGAGVNIVATSGEYVYADLHVFSAGTSADVRVQSATESTFATANTVHTFSVTAAGGNWMTRVAATSGQNYYRFNVVGITGSFQIAGAVGVQ